MGERSAAKVRDLDMQLTMQMQTTWDAMTSLASAESQAANRERRLESVIRKLTIEAEQKDQVAQNAKWDLSLKLERAVDRVLELESHFAKQAIHSSIPPSHNTSFAVDVDKSFIHSDALDRSISTTASGWTSNSYKQFLPSSINESAVSSSAAALSLDCVDSPANVASTSSADPPLARCPSAPTVVARRTETTRP